MSARFRRALLRLKNALAPARAESELEREVASHVALLEEALQARGMSAEEARLAAARRFGAVERVKGLQRDERSVPWLDDARQDLGATWRRIARRPGAAATAVVLIALAIAGITTLASVVYGVLFRPLPWSDGDALVRVEETRGGQRGRIPWTISNATYLAWQERHDTVEAIGGWRVLGQGLGLADGAGTQRVAAAAMTPSLLQVLRVSPLLGRGFVDDDASTPAPSTVILSHGLWQRAFGGRPDVVGETVRLDGRPHTVVGVMPSSFAFPDHIVQLWLPMHVMPVLGENGMRRVMIFGALARRRDGVAIRQASDEATARARQAPGLAQAALALFGNDGEIGVTGASARDVMTREARPGLLAVLTAVVLLLVAAMASVFNVQAARAAQRRREVALRAALGAGVSRLARQWVVETLAIGLAGAGLALALAAGIHRLLPTLLPAEFPRLGEVRLDVGVVAVSATVTLIASVISGLVPVWLGRRDAIVEVLAQDALSTVGASSSALVSRLRAAVIISQVAVACVLLVSTAILGRSFVNLLRADRGYDPRNVLTARVPLPPNATFAQYAAALDVVRGRVRAVPDVVEVAFGNALPLVTPGGFRGLTIPSPLDPSRMLDVQTALRAVTPDYFRALRLRVVGGRPLADTDAAKAPPVVVVNRTFAAQYLGGDAVGRRLTLGFKQTTDWEVVGVVEDMRQGAMSNSPSTVLGGVTDPPLPELFFAAAQWQDPVPEVVIVVRTTNDPAVHVPLLRAAFREAAPTLALDAISTMEERVTTSLALPRLYVVVLTALGVLALGLAAVGVFGVLAAATIQRTREIGVRTALGATRADVVRLVAGRVATSVAIGVGLGLAMAVVATRAVANQIYGVSATDSWSFLAAPLVLLAVGAVACAVPLVRALRIDPLTALRSP